MARILVAEDSQTDIKFIDSVLSELGHELFFATDGEATERMVQNERFDLIILDVVLPKKNGFQLCREFKRNEKTKDIPIIILTSKSQEVDKLWGTKQGANAYLTKPCSPIELITTVKRFIG
ncbi:MAG: response regulator [Thermodesulfovibrionales bacterium]|nr:response regulator [Thermodesulfovibrionales bacterium]